MLIHVILLISSHALSKLLLCELSTTSSRGGTLVGIKRALKTPQLENDKAHKIDDLAGAGSARSVTFDKNTCVMGRIGTGDSKISPLRTTKREKGSCERTEVQKGVSFSGPRPLPSF